MSKSEEHKWQEWLRKGEEAFHAGKTKDAIDEAGLYNLGARNAWLIGWRNAGGNISIPGHCKPLAPTATSLPPASPAPQSPLVVETPRTDAAFDSLLRRGEWADFARTLERELVAMVEECKDWKSQADVTQQLLEIERARLALQESALKDGERLRGALGSIAKQQMALEMDDEEYEHADCEGAYDICVQTARSALASPHADPTKEGQ